MPTDTESGNRSGKTQDGVGGRAGARGRELSTAGPPRRRSPISGTVYVGPAAPPPELPRGAPPAATIRRRQVPAGCTVTAPKVTSFDLDPELDGLPDDVRRRREYREAGELSGELLGELTGLVHGVHSALAGRVFRYVGSPAAPVRVAHDTVVGGIYGVLKAGGNGLAKAA